MALTLASGKSSNNTNNYLASKHSKNERPHDIDSKQDANLIVNGHVGAGDSSASRYIIVNTNSVATIMLPLGRSTNPFDPSTPNCQNWMRDYIQRLITKGLVASSTDSVVQNAPRLL
ncbi:hypothetical protein BDV41DRAFT_578899 [Aspergillus transmontanensis]|uniref:Uncharacterized protein n=1 Tax=Aspergillus transmontanensis TaxID=1034304 RepID=A0A5N6VS73_9EURO|nr:hypothetical protein BDV41DRAFT_578899 [Aspergillus transmontanensis]